MHDTHASILSKIQHANKKHLFIGQVFHFSILSGCDSREYLEKEKNILQTFNLSALKLKASSFEVTNNFDTSTFWISKQHKLNVVNKQVLSTYSEPNTVKEKAEN